MTDPNEPLVSSNGSRPVYAMTDAQTTAAPKEELTMRELLLFEAGVEEGKRQALSKVGALTAKTLTVGDVRKLLDATEVYFAVQAAVRESIAFYGSAAMGHARAEVSLSEIIATDAISAVMKALSPTMRGEGESGPPCASPD